MLFYMVQQAIPEQVMKTQSGKESRAAVLNLTFSTTRADSLADPTATEGGKKAT
jgi:hypothetical protein